MSTNKSSQKGKLMSVKELNRKLEIARATKSNLLIRGPVGVGKTRIIEQFAESKGVNCKTATLYGDPISVLGIPKLNSEYTEFSKSFLIKDIEDHDIIFIDEISNASIQSISCIMQLLSDREIGGHKIPPNVQIILACNGIQHSKAARAMPNALLNRVSIFDYDGPTGPEFTDYMLSNDWNPVLSSFLSKSPEMIIQKEIPDEQKPMYTPRSIESVNNLLNEFWDFSPESTNNIGSDIVERCGDVFYQRLRTYMELGVYLLDPLDIIKKPLDIDIKNIVKNERVAWITLYSLVPLFEEKTAEAIASFIGRMTPENQWLFYMLLPEVKRAEWANNDAAAVVLEKLIKKNKKLIHTIKGDTLT